MVPLCLSEYYPFWLPPSYCLNNHVMCCYAAFHCLHPPIVCLVFSMECALFLSLCPIHHPRTQLRNNLDIAMVQEFVRLVMCEQFLFCVNIE